MKLARSRTDAKLFGLCGGIAANLGVNPALVRAFVTVGIIISAGVLMLVYVIAAMLLPVEDAQPAGEYIYVPSSGAYGFHAPEPAPAAAQDISWSKEKEILSREIRELRSRLESFEQAK